MMFNGHRSSQIFSVAHYLYFSCNTNNINNGPAISILPFIAKNTLTTTSNSLMNVASQITPVVVSANTAALLISMKLLKSYLEVLNTILKKIANNQEIAEHNSRSYATHNRHTLLPCSTLMTFIKKSLQIRKRQLQTHF